MKPWLFVLPLLICTTVHPQLDAQTREEKVRNDRKRVEDDGFWIYNNLPLAFNTAKEEGKPLMVVLRCVPCEECVKLDDDLVDKDPVLRPLLEKFVRARQVSTNGLDLNLFQYDTDQSFAVFFLNADGAIYGRFGTRSHRTQWLKDVSVEGLADAMRGALALHGNYPANKGMLAGKQGKPLEFPRPELYPQLKGKFKSQLNFQGDVVRSCIHCHQIGEAQRAYYSDRGQTIPEQILFPYPHPKILGLIMSPKERGKIDEVSPGSTASKAGFRSGDELLSLNGQPVLSIADVQWVLHNTPPEGGLVKGVFRRDGKTQNVAIQLESDWRSAGDIAWRVTSWTYRRMVTGGLKLEEANEEQRQQSGVEAGQMALRVSHAGKYGPHGAAHRAGFKKEDIIVSFDGRTDLTTDSKLLAYGIRNHKAGKKISIKLVRDGRTRTLQIPYQK